MPEDIFDSSSHGVEIPVGKPKKRPSRRRTGARLGARVSKKESAHTKHEKQVNAALHAIAANGSSMDDMEVGGNISSFNPTPRFYRTIALTFLAGAVVLIGAVIAMTIGKAVITIKTQPETVTFDAPVDIAASASASAIKGVMRSVTVGGSRLVSPANGPEEPAYATGFVVLTNKAKQNQTLVATTRLLTGDNILFRLRKSVVVPFGGTVKAEVIADKQGKDGEIAPSHFRIPGLSESLQQVIYADSSAAMTGGTVRKAVMTQDDVDKGVAALTADLLLQGKTQLNVLVNASSSAPLIGVFTDMVKDVKNDGKIGAVTTQFTVTLTLEVEGVYFANDEVNGYISQAIQGNTTYAGATVSPVGEPETSINRFDEKGQTAELHIKQEWMAKAKNYGDLIDKKQLAGLTARDAVQSLKGLDWVDDARVAISPSWTSHIPKNIDKIDVVFEQ